MELDKEELAQFNGRSGQPAYVAVDDKIYDVTSSRLWKNGIHMKRHAAGLDLTTELAAAPHGPEVLERFELKGHLKTEGDAEKAPLPQWILNILEKYPFLQRHPHPMVVHFPMAFFITASLFLAWYYLLQPLPSLLDAIFYMHILGTLSLPFALVTGWISWLANYFGKRIGLIIRKIVLSFVLLVLDIIVLIALVKDTTVLANPQGLNLVYPIFIFCYLPIASLIGEHGGRLVFPIHKKKTT